MPPSGRNTRPHGARPLLATGATNRDIAHALALSVRTAEHHVASTLKKLGVDRRGPHPALTVGRRVAPSGGGPAVDRPAHQVDAPGGRIRPPDACYRSDT
ncbi:LuxR C-terminal-related transcriptional regulator [Kitasatospora sp. NBC_00240]|uniref:LuxR C-terminal-related transcriptional regulator n=1 Tax=Kitasatospora sp. NBC_00240 TaxID=2903567 RepID=UPI002258DABF|nr:LuxR C-terminal-related transcriptional regulator [Kitasatospora sp. NBC_00240]MCX5208533.1 LuxR C-terminal-related transcriptional regulator [Kitasatospora sp. NBC_00240]